MTLSRTFALGAALATLPLAIGLAFTVDKLQEVASGSERLMQRQLTAVRLGTGVVVRLDRLSEYLSKHAVSQDEAYALKAAEIAAATDRELEGIARDADPDRAHPRLETFTADWRSLRARAEGPTGMSVAEVDALASRARELLALAHAAAERDVALAAEHRAAAWRTALTATVVALLSSIIALVLVVRRVRRRLDDFVSATTAVSRGAFSAQLSFGNEDDELGRVAKAFNRMVSALDQLERLKADFLSSISHELRTPLVAMVETNEALLDDVAGPLTDQQRRMISLNAGAARRLSGMIGDLLELSVVRSSMRYEMASTTLGPVVRDAIAELDTRVRERGLALEVEGCDQPLSTTGDRGRISQVVQNLLVNAIKHTPAGGRIEVSLQRAKAPEGRPIALLRVDDTGPGIPEHDRERVFEKFFRRQGVSADGVGLGLAICREIVHAHRGAIWIEDGRLGGASVCVALPVEGG